jgi:hypothetical protein
MFTALAFGLCAMVIEGLGTDPIRGPALGYPAVGIGVLAENRCRVSTFRGRHFSYPHRGTRAQLVTNSPLGAERVTEGARSAILGRPGRHRRARLAGCLEASRPHTLGAADLAVPSRPSKTGMADD